MLKQDRIKLILSSLAVGWTALQSPVASADSYVANANAAGSPTSNVCVLIFETRHSPLSEAVKGILKDHPGVFVKDMALPSDIVDCIKSRATEIMIIGHALETPHTIPDKSPVNLAYFRELTGDERQSAISDVIQSATQQISADQKAGESPQTAKNISQLQTILQTYQTWPESKPYIIIQPMLPHVFQVARQVLNQQAKSSEGIALQEIRLESCQSKGVIAEYDDLRGLVADHGIKLDVAPNSKLMSLLYHQSVTSPSPQWIRESIPDGEETQP